MKKIITAKLFFLFLAATFNTAWSQATLRPDAGYFFSLNGADLNCYQNSITGLQPSIPIVHGSWGKGLSIGAMLDYKFNKYITLELGCHYHYGSDISLTDNVGGLTNTLSDRSHMFVFSLGYYYEFTTSVKFKPYINGGVLYSVDNNISITETSDDEFSNNTIFTSKLTCSSAVGPYIEVGVKLQISERVYFFSELRFEELSLTPKKLYVSSEVQNNDDITNTLMPYQQGTNYVTNLSSTPFSQLNPTQVIAQKIPASAWGFNLGFAFKFGKSKATTMSQQ